MQYNCKQFVKAIWRVPIIYYGLLDFWFVVSMVWEMPVEPLHVVGTKLQ